MARNITLLSYSKAAAESKIYKATTVALFTNQANYEPVMFSVLKHQGNHCSTTAETNYSYEAVLLMYSSKRMVTGLNWFEIKFRNKLLLTAGYFK